MHAGCFGDPADADADAAKSCKRLFDGRCARFRQRHRDQAVRRVVEAPLHEEQLRREAGTGFADQDVVDALDALVHGQA